MVVKISIRYKQTVAQDFVILVNPKNIALDGRLWTDLYPVAWKVAEFGSDGRGEDFTREFSGERTIGVFEHEEKNLVRVGSAMAVGKDHKNNKFKVVKEGDGQGVVLDASPNTDVSAEIYNALEDRIQVFYGDKNKAPFIVSDVSKEKTIVFSEPTEIVIVAVSDYHGGWMLQSSIRGTWMKFLLNDAASHDHRMFVEYDSEGKYVLFDGCNTPFEQFHSNIPLFSASEP
ncbi:MAG: hypothetical protein J3R72DRAFT_425278 [Linnemannia gamsii]|nr:MAG: hypothetical protein J3R72DRAFT_425278 [Linnemannia gamsii]